MRYFVMGRVGLTLSTDVGDNKKSDFKAKHDLFYLH